MLRDHAFFVCEATHLNGDIMGFWIELTTGNYIGCKVELMLNLKYATPTLLLISENYNNNNNIAFIISMH